MGVSRGGGGRGMGRGGARMTEPPGKWGSLME